MYEALCLGVIRRWTQAEHHAQMQVTAEHANEKLRNLLQGLVTCGQCGYAYYGKALSLCSRRGRPRDYASYRCLGTDAYRFGGERVCDNAQVRTDRLEAVTWHEVSELLREPDRLEQEYRHRLVAESEQSA